jgi:hypothetical protein
MEPLMDKKRMIMEEHEKKMIEIEKNHEKIMKEIYENHEKNMEGYAIRRQARIQGRQKRKIYFGKVKTE